LSTGFHDVLFIAEVDAGTVDAGTVDAGTDDETVLRRSRDQNAVLLTADKDFGELVFRQGRLHSGIVPIRLAGLAPEAEAGLVASAYERHGDELKLGFAVSPKHSLRLRRTRA
jgi:predicted nuclease of predicted toxin-antitoxin system